MNWYTADPHFGHGEDSGSGHRASIITMMCRGVTGALGAWRLFETQTEHDNHLIENINQCVDRNDKLFIIGDFAWDNPQKFRQMIRCRHVHLIRGNHDKFMKCKNTFGEVPDIKRCRITSDTGDTAKVFMSHYPHAYWDGSHRTTFHLYGHVHAQREDYLDMMEPDRRSMDVGVDNAQRLLGEYRPFSEHEIFHFLGSRIGHDNLDFYHQYQKELYEAKGLDIGKDSQW